MREVNVSGFACWTGSGFPAVMQLPVDIKLMDNDDCSGTWAMKLHQTGIRTLRLYRITWGNWSLGLQPSRWRTQWKVILLVVSAGTLRWNPLTLNRSTSFLFIESQIYIYIYKSEGERGKDWVKERWGELEASSEGQRDREGRIEGRTAGRREKGKESK